MQQTATRGSLLLAGSSLTEWLKMLSIMAEERGGRAFTTDDRYCIDNGAMIAYTGSSPALATSSSHLLSGLLMFRNGHVTPLSEATCTQVCPCVPHAFLPPPNTPAAIPNRRSSRQLAGERT